MGSTQSARHRALLAVIRGLRHQKKWSQEQAAKKIGWSQSKLAQIEVGQRQVYYSEVFDLAKGYGLDPLRLIKLAIDWEGK